MGEKPLEAARKKDPSKLGFFPAHPFTGKSDRIAVMFTLGLAAATMILAFSAGATFAGQADPESGKKEAPNEGKVPNTPGLQWPGPAGEPYVPSISRIPDGFPLEPWKTWVDGQEVDPFRRVSIEAYIRNPFGAAGGFNVGKSYHDFWRIWLTVGTDVYFNLVPAASVFIGFGYSEYEGRETVAYPDGFNLPGSPTIRLHDFRWWFGYGGIKISFPVFHPARFLQVSPAETPTGLMLFGHFRFGFSQIQGGAKMFYDGLAEPACVLRPTSTWYLAVGLGFGYRWKWFGIDVAAMNEHIGAPQRAGSWMEILLPSAQQDEPYDVDIGAIEISVSFHF